MKKKRQDIQINKKDSNNLFSGRFKSQIFKDKKDKLEQEETKRRQKKDFDTD